MKKFNELNAYLSNLAVMNTKLHNLHWNVVGINFVAIHTFTEELYTKYFEEFDAVAELLKMQGQTPLSRMKDYLDHATIEEIAPKAFSIKEVLDILIKDLGILKDQAVKVRDLAEEEGDFEAVSMFEDTIAVLNKDLWFLDAMAK